MVRLSRVVRNFALFGSVRQVRVIICKYVIPGYGIYFYLIRRGLDLDDQDVIPSRLDALTTLLPGCINEKRVMEKLEI
jgi:hypothetical protein